MANHASADKRFRQSEKRRLHNKYYARTTRNAIKAIRNTTDKAAAEQMAPKVFAMIDKLAKTNVRGMSVRSSPLFIIGSVSWC